MITAAKESFAQQQLLCEVKSGSIATPHFVPSGQRNFILFTLHFSLLIRGQRDP
jgi:hypothetical protein